MMPAQRLSVIVPFYVVFLQLMQQMIVTGPLRLDDASTLYCRPRSDLSWLPTTLFQLPAPSVSVAYHLVSVASPPSCSYTFLMYI